MRLSQYMISEGRGVEVELYKVVDDIRKNYSDALGKAKKQKYIYRGVDGVDSDVYFIQPSKFSRASANTGNLYTLIIDNDPAWKAYPKRSQSIICSSEESGAFGYGGPYIVLPKNGYKIGVCPAIDMWDSFTVSLGASLGTSYDLPGMLDHLQKFCYDMFNVNFGDFVKIEYKSLLKKFYTIDDKIKSGNFSRFKHWDEISSTDAIFKYYNGSMLKMVRNILNPNKNKFKVSKNISDIKGYVEVWTDADSYMIALHYWKFMMNEI